MSYWEDEQRKREEEAIRQTAQAASDYAEHSFNRDNGYDPSTDFNVSNGNLPSQEEIDRRRAEIEEGQRQAREAQEQFQPTASSAVNQSLFNKKNAMDRNVELGDYAVASDIADSYLKQLQNYAKDKRENAPEHVDVGDYREEFLQQKENELAKRMIADLNMQRIEEGLRKKNIEEGGNGVRLGESTPIQQGHWGLAAQGNQINPNFDHEWAEEMEYTAHPNGGYSLYNNGVNQELFDPFTLSQEEFNNGLANLPEYIEPYLIPGNENLPTYDNLQYENFMHELYGDEDIGALMELENVRRNPYGMQYRR